MRDIGGEEERRIGGRMFVMHVGKISQPMGQHLILGEIPCVFCFE